MHTNHDVLGLWRDYVSWYFIKMHIILEGTKNTIVNGCRLVVDKKTIDDLD
jgi:hypothetical protein